VSYQESVVHFGRMDALLSGLGLGFGVAAGFGPINVLCLTTGLRNGFAPAFGIGLGAALVDGLYAVLAGLGAAAVLGGDAGDWFQVFGGAALVVIGIRIARAARGTAESPATAGSLWGAFALSVAATAANPLTIVSWAAAFAGVVPALDLTRLETLTILPLAIAAGTLSWFTLVSAAAAYARRFATERVLRAVSLVGGLVIAAIGVVIAVEGVRGL
jgi:threonine/homoserine/homoserine lactone efflux protein